MVTLSLAMIVKNEEGTLSAVLADAREVCDEMVVVDTGSTDRTVEIALEAGAKVEHFAWIDDFAAARNAAFAHCTGDWILWLDADDRVPVSCRAAILGYKENLLGDELDAVFLPYRYQYSADGSQCTLELTRERLLRRAAGFQWEGRIHEVISVPEHDRLVYRDDAWVEHRPLPDAQERKGDRNLRILERAVQEGDRSQRSLFYYGNELVQHGRDSEAIAAWAEFLDHAPRGWERYEALLYMARAQLRIEGDSVAEATAHRAIRENPARAEAYVFAGLIHYEAGRWAEAIPYLLAATGCRRPDEGFVRGHDYTYAPWDYLSICYHRVGDQPRALDALARALDGNPERERLVDNAKWITEAW